MTTILGKTALALGKVAALVVISSVVAISLRKNTTDAQEYVAQAFRHGRNSIMDRRRAA